MSCYCSGGGGLERFRVCDCTVHGYLLSGSRKPSALSLFRITARLEPARGFHFFPFRLSLSRLEIPRHVAVFNCLLMPEELGPPEAGLKDLAQDLQMQSQRAPHSPTSIIPFSSSPQRNTEARTGLDFLISLTLTWTAGPSP